MVVLRAVTLARTLGRVTVPDPSTAPNPDRTTGLEPGSGVTPGETPPAEASVTSELGATHQSAPTGRSASFLVFAIGLGVVMLLIVVGLVGKLAGLV